MDINRQTAFLTLLEIEKNNAYSNIELNKMIKEHNPDAPAFVRELVYGVLENQFYLDFLLKQLVAKGWSKIKANVLTDLRIGLYQLIYMNSVPDYAAVNESVRLARKYCKGREGFINGVLRGYMRKKDLLVKPGDSGDSVERLSITYSAHPTIVKLWIEQFGEERCESLLKASNEKPPLALRVNLLRTTVQELTDILERKGFEVKNGKISERTIFVKGSGIIDLKEYKDGFFSVQDESSTLAVEILAPTPRDIVYDICAAPGGKTTAIGEIMGNKGDIYAFDLYEHKIKLIERECQRLGLTNIHIEQNDARQSRDELKETADKVLVDGPCSGLGVLKRKPEIKFRSIETQGEKLSKIQLDILSTSEGYVKRGGFLLYSTCTINQEENRDIIDAFLKQHQNFELMRVRQLMPDEDETDGFFICKMKKH